MPFRFFPLQHANFMVRCIWSQKCTEMIDGSAVFLTTTSSIVFPWLHNWKACSSTLFTFSNLCCNSATSHTVWVMQKCAEKILNARRHRTAFNFTALLFTLFAADSHCAAPYGWSSRVMLSLLMKACVKQTRCYYYFSASKYVHKTFELALKLYWMERRKLVADPLFCCPDFHLFCSWRIAPF